MIRHVTPADELPRRVLLVENPANDRLFREVTVSRQCLLLRREVLNDFVQVFPFNCTDHHIRRDAATLQICIQVMNRMAAVESGGET